MRGINPWAAGTNEIAALLEGGAIDVPSITRIEVASFHSNRSSSAGAIHAPSITRSEEGAATAAAMGRADGSDVPARRRGLVRRLAGGIRRALPTARPKRDLSPPEPGEEAQLSPGPLGPVGCGPGRRPNIRLQSPQGRCGTDQQLDRSRHDEADSGGTLQRMYARPHHVR